MLPMENLKVGHYYTFDTEAGKGLVEAVVGIFVEIKVERGRLGVVVKPEGPRHKKPVFVPWGSVVNCHQMKGG